MSPSPSSRAITYVANSRLAPGVTWDQSNGLHSPFVYYILCVLCECIQYVFYVYYVYTMCTVYTVHVYIVYVLCVLTNIAPGVT